MNATTRMMRGGYVARSQERQDINWFAVSVLLVALMAVAAGWWVYGFTSSIDEMALKGVVGR